MKIYLQIIKFSLLKYLIYPWESFAIIANRLISLSALIIFWLAVDKSANGIINFKEIISYFLISGAIDELIFSRDWKFGRAIQKTIKTGDINNYMLKPLKLIPYLFSSVFVGKQGMNIILGIIYLIIGIILNPPKTIGNLITFPIFLLISITTSISINIFIASIQFYTKEAGGIKNAIAHVTRVLSGGLVPLQYFPENIRWIIESLPFGTMIYGPTKILQSNGLSNSTFTQFAISLFWAIFLPIIFIKFWNKSIKNYDAVGI